MKILIEALHGLGDTVCLLPMIVKVREKYPEAEITVLLKFGINKAIIEASKIKIEHVFILNMYSSDVLSTLKKLIFLHNQNFDLAISSANTPINKAKLFMKLINPKKVVGLQHKKNLCFDLLHDKYHFVEANLMAIKSLDISSQDHIAPKLYAETSIKKQLRKDMQLNSSMKVIGLCIGDADFSYRNRWLRTGKVFTRGWGISNMLSLTRELLAKTYTVVLIGGKLEENLLENIPNEILENKNLINMVNKTNLQESMALVTLCDVAVGVDTGMMHIADALGVKTVSIFGPTNPKTHGAYSDQASFVEVDLPCKYCYGTKNYVECKDRECLKCINVMDVLRAMEL